MANYAEDRDKRVSLREAGKNGISVRLLNERVVALDKEGRFLGVDKRLQAEARAIAQMSGDAKAKAIAAFADNASLAWLCQVDENGDPAKVVRADGTVTTATYGWCLVKASLPGEELFSI